MSSGKKILVIVCAYNEAQHIEKCLNSLISSIKKAKLATIFKIVCVDNSSIDGTFEIAKSVSDSQRYVSIDCIKIAHVSLCISRNFYKYYPEYDYIAYVDADGMVDANWAQNLQNSINKNNCDVYSGPVLPVSISTETNFFWEINYDHQLEKGHYLIGANMTFSKTFLDECGGFPNVFPVRGDESCLLIKARYLSVPKKMVFDKQIITYNHFPVKLKTILYEAWGDGNRSALLRSLAHTKNEFLPRIIYRAISVLSFVVGILTTIFSINLGTPLLFLSFLIVLVGKYFKIIKIFQKPGLSLLQKIAAIIVLILITKVFNISYLLTILTHEKLTIFDLKKVDVPEIISDNSEI